jgi:hypothetical protein
MAKIRFRTCGKILFRVYSGEVKESVLAPCVGLVCCWSSYVLLMGRDIFTFYQEARTKYVAGFNF